METGKSTEFLVEHSGHRKLKWTFWWGAHDEFPVEAMVEYGREMEKQYKKQFRFTITTNGLLLDDEALEYINREFVNVVISIDGRRGS